MASKDDLRIDLRAVAASQAPLHFTLGDDFFQGLDQTELTGGALDAEAKVRENADGTFSVTLALEGEVETVCDRCLDTLRLPVSGADTVRVAYGSLGDNPDLRYTGRNTRSYDLGWDIYEIAVTALPIERTHAEGECDEDMIRRFGTEPLGDEV